MNNNEKGKRKIFNDPVYGFISISSDLHYKLIEHQYFQRLRRIRQLGMSNLVYPGTNHTRFQHALGAAHLMESALNVLELKGNEVTRQEREAAIAAILLHDIGHGPYSHTLESSLIKGLIHEDISLAFMEVLNDELAGELDLAIEIFKGNYHKKYLHQLVSGQLDMDRLDYLKRDSFFSGVYEGAIGSDRIIKMLDIRNDELVVESKGIYSIEKFLIARRLMYWQVYLHKTVIGAEFLLLKILNSVKELIKANHDVPVTPLFEHLLINDISRDELLKDHENRRRIINDFARLDDSDVIVTLKMWMNHPDKLLALLAGKFINRELFKIEISNTPFEEEKMESIKELVKKHYGFINHDMNYLVFTGSISNNLFSPVHDKIKILYKNEDIEEIDKASDMLYLKEISKEVTKYFLCYPKECIW